ncbi:MAG: murein L,D-transpeptidase catalytic domain-containing protein [Bacteroidota bacterium]
MFIPIQPAQFALVILPRCWPLVFILVFSAACRNGADRKLNQSKQSDSVVQPERVSALVKKGLTQLPWLKRTGYSQRYILLADLSLPMNEYRLFLVDLEKNKVLLRLVMAHGSGRGSTIEEAVCSNEPGSNCSSLGRYRFGANYNGRWGNSFRLHGLDPGNNRALQRAIVFHYYQYMTDDPESGSLYYSQGCPMVPKSTYLKVKKIVESESQPLVLWIYK